VAQTRRRTSWWTVSKFGEQERHNALSSITRLTQLYDLEKVFGSTLEIDELLPLIGSKFRELLECQAVNVWLLQGDESLLLMHQSGIDPTVHEGMTEKPGEGLAGQVQIAEPGPVPAPQVARLGGLHPPHPHPPQIPRPTGTNPANVVPRAKDGVMSVQLTATRTRTQDPRPLPERAAGCGGRWTARVHA